MNEKLRSFLKHRLPPYLIKTIKAVRSWYRKFLISRTLYFQIHVTYHCNLKCKCCSHFSPISENSFLDIHTFENDLKQLASLRAGKNIRKIDLLGGEPLLHPQINDFIAAARNCFGKSEIVLLTNGILLPAMPDSFWEACHKNRIVIAISNYPIHIDIKTINNLVLKYGIAVTWGNKNEVKMPFGHFKMDIEGRQNGKLNAKYCFESKNCHCLDHGRMFLCYLPACIGIFNRQFDKHIPVSPADYIDIYKCKSIFEIIRFLKKPAPFCDYCNLKDRNAVEWGISKQTIDEWT